MAAFKLRVSSQSHIGTHSIEKAGTHTGAQSTKSPMVLNSQDTFGLFYDYRKPIEPFFKDIGNMPNYQFDRRDKNFNNNSYCD